MVPETRLNRGQVWQRATCALGAVRGKSLDIACVIGSLTGRKHLDLLLVIQSTEARLVYRHLWRRVVPSLDCLVHSIG